MLAIKSKRSIMLLFLLLPVFSIFIPTVIGINLDSSLIGVNEGYSFNIEVVTSPDGTGDKSQIYRTTVPDGGYDKPSSNDDQGTSEGASSFGIDNFRLLPGIDLPDQGIIFSIKVLKIPENDSTGKIEVNVQGSKREYDIDFSYGSFITFLNWSYWTTHLKNINNEFESERIDSVSTTITDKTTTFQSEIKFNLKISDDASERIRSKTITQYARYNKETGVLDFIKVDYVIDTTFKGIITRTTYLQFTTKAPTPPDYSFLYLLVIGGLSATGVGAIVVKRRLIDQMNFKTVSEHKSENITKIKDRLADIQAKIAEIDKKEASYLNDEC